MYDTHAFVCVFERDCIDPGVYEERWRERERERERESEGVCIHISRDRLRREREKENVLDRFLWIN